ncbi:MAG: hypothetical protein RSC68_02250 [Acinetobacter sp.]
MNKMAIYNRLPVWGQNLACHMEGKKIAHDRYGKAFWNSLSEYESHKEWSYEQRCDFRDAKLRKMIHHCYDTVPYYTKLLNEGGINPDSIKTLDDLKVLPILTKQIVNADPDAFLSTDIPKNRMVTAHTSGTTGSGFVFKTTQQAICEQWAVWWRYRRAIGIEFGTRSANFGSRLVVPAAQSKTPFWRYNQPCNQIYFSAFHEKPCNLKYYVDEIVNSGVPWLHGYPSLLTPLGEYILANGIDLKGQVRFVTTGAENLLENQRRILSQAFGVVPYQHYGLSEGVANFSENSQHTITVEEDFSAVEFIPFGSTYRVIGTGLNNEAMPLLRWDTKDTVIFCESATEGRQITSIDGRIEDYVVLPNGTQIGKLDHVFKDTVHLMEVQIHQNKDYSITVYATTDGTDVTDDIHLAQKTFDESFGVPIPIQFKIVDSISKPAGKLRFVVSEIKRKVH